VPLTAGGKLTLVASSDLGGLGARDGSPVPYHWTLPGIAPLLLPWLIILVLLVLKPNRCAAAWLIWLPLGCVAVLTQNTPSFLPSGTNFLLDAITALAIGLATVWLLAGYLRPQNRFVTFLCVLPALAGFSLLAMVAKQGVSLLTLDSYAESLQIGIVLAVAVLASAAALSLCGLVGRGRYQPLGLYLWPILLLMVLWLVIVSPFFLFAVMASGGNIPWSEFFIPVLAVAAVNYATLLPFIILSSASPFYCGRLKALLQVKPVVPPVMPPVPETGLKT
jgi:hypothetical protein